MLQNRQNRPSSLDKKKKKKKLPRKVPSRNGAFKTHEPSRVQRQPWVSEQLLEPVYIPTLPLHRIPFRRLRAVTQDQKIRVLGESERIRSCCETAAPTVIYRIGQSIGRIHRRRRRNNDYWAGHSSALVPVKSLKTL